MAKSNLRSYVALFALCLMSLDGCSGGGGGSASGTSAPASTPAPVNFALPTAGTTSGVAVNLQAAKATVTYPAAAATAIGANGGMGNITLAVVGQGATITLSTDASGNLSGVTIPAGNIHDTVFGGGGPGHSLTDPLTLDFYYQLQDVFAFDNDSAYTISQVAAGQGLTSSAYGLWASSGSGYGFWAATGKAFSSDAGAFAFGNLTPPTAVPATGSATFSGFTVGFGGATDGSAVFTLKGNAQIIANFASQTVTTNLTNFGTDNISYNSTVTAHVPNLTGTSTISGNAYTGPISGGALTGTINGNFYGSAAQETAGVWQASGGGNAWLGSFGAK
jgi:hypothetical protein